MHYYMFEQFVVIYLCDNELGLMLWMICFAHCEQSMIQWLPARLPK